MNGLNLPRPLARMAELADDSCLAFGCPELARFLPFSPEIKSKLESPQALRLLENVLPHSVNES